MKKIVITTDKNDLRNIEKTVKDKIYFLKKDKDILSITVYVNDEDLDDLINKLDNTVDFRYKKSLIEVSTPDFILSSSLKRNERKAEKEKEKEPVEKLIDSTRPYLKLDVGRVGLTSIAGLIALTGLFMNNIAIIIGAMLLSPLLGPIYSFAINTAVGKEKDALKGVGNILILLGLVILISYVVTEMLIQFVYVSLTSEIIARTDPSFVYIIMALLLGFASILALSKGISESIAGVAIAAAILPPAVVTGISIAMYSTEIIGALMLTLENLVGLMAGGLSATLILDIGPRKYYEKTIAKGFIVRTFLAIILLLLLLFVFSIIWK